MLFVKSLSPSVYQQPLKAMPLNEKTHNEHTHTHAHTDVHARLETQGSETKIHFFLVLLCQKKKKNLRRRF